MQINLKQAEIVTALQQYIGGQGINLAGKTFTVTFTAGRKEAGLLADISIENDTATQAAVAPAVVAQAAPAPAAVEVAAPAPLTEKKTLDAAPPAVVKGIFGGNTNIVSEDELNERPLGQVMGSATAEAKPVVKATSLFGA